MAELETFAQAPTVTDPWADLHGLAGSGWHHLHRSRTELLRDGEPADDALHRLRLRGKRARCAAELLPTTPAVETYLAALTEFQDVLGEHQDACVLEDTLRDLPGRVVGRAGVAVGRVVERCRTRKVAARATYPAAWAAVAAAADEVFGPDR